MTILYALAARYERLAARGEMPVPGFGPAQIGFTIVLDAEGRVVGVDDDRVGEGKRLRPKVVEAPQAPSDRRGERIVAGAFWDPSDYALGVPKLDPKEPEARLEKQRRKAVEKHAAFKDRHMELLAASNDPGCAALSRFLQTWKPDQLSTLAHAGDIPGQNVAFRLEGDACHIHDRQAARFALANGMAERTAKRGVCLVTGVEAPIQRLHLPIKGIGDKLAPLVSFNEDAFTSYGKTQGDNAPVSEAAAFAYATALNGLISATSGTDKTGRPLYRNRVNLGGDTVVFWAETDKLEAEALLNSFFDSLPDDQTETAAVRKVMLDMQAGRPIEDAAPGVDPATRAYVLGLSSNAARLSVRFWVDRTLGDLAVRFAEHWADLRLEPASQTLPPPVWALLYELASQRKAENVPAHLAGELTRAILTGGRYPESLLAQALMRVRADGEVTPLRAALVKAVLARRGRKACEQARRHDPAHPDWKDTLVSLDRDETNIGYRLGRLFALLDYAQYLSVGSVNAGVKEKFFASASSTPGRVFPTMLRTSQYHLSDARKSHEKRRSANWADAEIKQVMDGLSASQPFPPTLNLGDQGRFVVGYYHQRSGKRTDRDAGAAPPNGADINGAETDDAETEE